MTRNRLEGRNEYGDGTIRLTDLEDAVVTSNEIEMTDGRIPLIVLGCGDSVLSHNQLLGKADIGVVVAEGRFGTPSTGNEIVGNDLANAELDLTYVLAPLTHSNTVRGYTGGADTVVDLNPLGPYAGMPNHITGVTPMSEAGGIGETAKAAAERMHDAKTRSRDTLTMLERVRERHTPLTLFSNSRRIGQRHHMLGIGTSAVVMFSAPQRG